MRSSDKTEVHVDWISGRSVREDFLEEVRLLLAWMDGKRREVSGGKSRRLQNRAEEHWA